MKLVSKLSELLWPVLFFGAGLPQVAAMSGDAKSYAERLFNYPYIGALPDKEAKNAIKNPITSLHEAINVDALERIVQYTKGYPYFLQEWGSEVWNVATDGQPISLFGDFLRRQFKAHLLFSHQ
ncbi:hypothetical protein [Pelistega europaea]|uniref:hypothetical protein n=1 Tax=Pelistega europaea TaxID=106147 RepID=UPI001C0F4E9D|nr:hypothetical protein [Pelistega europaea]